jgi:acetylornithine deacetylase/succinyl-diaminopimelate desuccinylase-like protein
MAKVSCRLVPDQDPEKTRQLFERHVRDVAPPGVKVEVLTLHGGKPWRAKLEGRLYEAASRALESAWGRDVVYAGQGGSIPIVPEFERVLRAPVLLMGFGLPGENAHAPDEWMSVENFEKGTVAAARLLDELAG